MKILLRIFILLSTLLCITKSLANCDLDNVYQNLKCTESENKKILIQLKNRNNNKTSDFKKWSSDVQKKCEGSTSYALGEGIGLIKEKCYQHEYLSRLEYLKTGKNDTKELNYYNLEITALPYNSKDHLQCLESGNKDSCRKVNLIKSSKLVKYYSFISPSFGDGVVLKENQKGSEIIILPFLANENEGVQLAIYTIDKFGVVKEKYISAQNNVSIDKNYNITYYFKGNKVQEKL